MIPEFSEVYAAAISAITSIIVLAIAGVSKYFYERYSINYRLKKEYEYEQRKNFRGEIGKYKVKLLYAAEELNHRLWNFAENRCKGWHSIEKENYSSPSGYYFHSFIYRFLVFFY